jgi:tripartite-type tricarboxylate transporter receptor subunit TctC
MARRFAVILSLLSLVLVSLNSDPAWSQAGRTIKIIVPFPPGGSADILARLLGEQINKAHGHTMLVENRPGAGASIAYEAVARAAPDGNTVVIAANSVVINPILKKTNYDPLSSFEAICYLVRSPLVFVVNSVSPHRTLGDLIAAAKAKPGEVNLASVGPATTQHIGIEQFQRVAAINVTYIPYAGGAAAINALLGQHVTAVLANYSEVFEQLNVGKLRALATASRTRIAPLPNVPTVAESGYADYDTEVWFGVLAPAKTPKQATTELAGWFAAAVKDPTVEPRLVALGLYPTGLCGTDFTTHIKKQSEDYGNIIRDAKIKME